jgi:hypothetical protein
MSSPSKKDLIRQELQEKLKRGMDKFEKGETPTEDFTEEEMEIIKRIMYSKIPVKKSGSGCMVTLLIIIAPTILLSLLIFA